MTINQLKKAIKLSEKNEEPYSSRGDLYSALTFLIMTKEIEENAAKRKNSRTQNELAALGLRWLGRI